MKLLVCVKNLKMSLKALSLFRDKFRHDAEKNVLKLPSGAYIGYIVD
jgi:hypothetical protein